MSNIFYILKAWLISKIYENDTIGSLSYAKWFPAILSEARILNLKKSHEQDLFCWVN